MCRLKPTAAGLVLAVISSLSRRLDCRPPQVPPNKFFPGVCDPAQESCPVAQGSTVHTSEKERGLGIGRSYWVYTQGIILETRLWCWFLFLHQSLVFFFGRDSANWRYQGGAEEVYSNRGNKQGKAETKHWDIGWRAKPQILPRP